jgi:hypothetical protein
MNEPVMCVGCSECKCRRIAHDSMEIEGLRREVVAARELAGVYARAMDDLRAELDALKEERDETQRCNLLLLQQRDEARKELSRLRERDQEERQPLCTRCVNLAGPCPVASKTVNECTSFVPGGAHS